MRRQLVGQPGLRKTVGVSSPAARREDRDQALGWLMTVLATAARLGLTTAGMLSSLMPT
jgi:hypothetical protein